MATVRILAIGANIPELERTVNALVSQISDLDIRSLGTLQTIRETERAFSNYNSIKPDVVLLDNSIVNDSGGVESQEKIIAILKTHGFDGPIVACSPSCSTNAVLMELGATHRVDQTAQRDLLATVPLHERLKGTENVIRLCCGSHI